MAAVEPEPPVDRSPVERAPAVVDRWWYVVDSCVGSAAAEESGEGAALVEEDDGEDSSASSEEPEEPEEADVGYRRLDASPLPSVGAVALGTAAHGRLELVGRCHHSIDNRQYSLGNRYRSIGRTAANCWAIRSVARTAAAVYLLACAI